MHTPTTRRPEPGTVLEYSATEARTPAQLALLTLPIGSYVTDKDGDIWVRLEAPSREPNPIHELRWYVLRTGADPETVAGEIGISNTWALTRYLPVTVTHIPDTTTPDTPTDPLTAFITTHGHTAAPTATTEPTTEPPTYRVGHVFNTPTGPIDHRNTANELDALSIGTALLDRSGDVWQKRDEQPHYGEWACALPHHTIPATSYGIIGNAPLTVIHIP